jgi:ATP-dependent DNA helicase RecQ
MWPTGLPAIGVDLRGRIPADEQPEPGRAVGRLSDLGWGNRLRPLLSERAGDGAVPDDVLNALVTVVSDWATSPGGWASGEAGARRRPVAVVTVGSRARPRLVRSLGERIAAVGRMPLLGEVTHDGQGPPPGRSNGAQRVRALHGTLELPAQLAQAVGAAGGPLLLIDDFTESGWTLAMAARLLRRAGAEEVLPLVLAVQG